MKTNVYVANYEDLSQLSVNAENLATAIKEFAQIKNEEPMLLQRKITGIQIPDPPEPLPVVSIICRAEREEESEVLPDTVTIRPSTSIERNPGDVVMLYAIDTDPTPEVEFAGWYDDAGVRLSTDAAYAYTVPDAASGTSIDLIAKFRTKTPATTYTVAVEKEMSDGVSPVPASCVVRPESATVDAGESVVLYAVVTDVAYTFVGWKDAEGTILSTDATFAYTPTADTILTAVFGEV